MVNEATNRLYREKGIDFSVRGDREAYYELEHRKSAWRTAMDPNGKIIYEFEHVDELLPHGLLMPFDLKECERHDRQFRFPTKESELFNEGTDCVSLYNGDLFTISKKARTETVVFGDVYKPNHNQSKEVFNAFDLLEDNWRIVNEALLKELGLLADEVLILYGLIDSFVIRTDASKTSSLILGQMFDIGLRFFKALSQPEYRLMVVTDLVKLLRAKTGGKTSFPVMKKGEYIYFDVYLSEKALQVVKDYFAKFPELVNYMKQNVSKWSKKFVLPRVHDVNYDLTLDQ